mmetsp:Transcript_90654/g.293452  ORF Transcript_90654/g.293452 Transcript_90654/m.293452 type:complete len:232 (-) Transcript_90654:152-847(-)
MPGPTFSTASCIHGKLASKATSSPHLHVGTGRRHQASEEGSSLPAMPKLVMRAPATAKADSSSASFARMPFAISCISETESSSAPGMPTLVTSAWMPTRNQSSSPVHGLRATVSPRRSRRFRNRSPDLRRFWSTAVKGAPVAHATRRRTRSAGSNVQPTFRKRQFLPKTSPWEKPVMVSNFCETAIRGMSGLLGSAMVTQNWTSSTAARSASLIVLSPTTLDAMTSISEHW